MNDVVIIVPVLNRPTAAAPLVENIEAATPEDHRILFVANGEGDMAELRAVKATGADVLVLPGGRQRGDYARKINFAYRNSLEPLLFLAADDLIFHPGWLTAALKKLEGRIQVVGTNDLANQRTMNGDHSTHTLVTRAYCDVYGTIDEPACVLHEGYNHWYVDDEFIRTAVRREAFAPCLESHVEHTHYFVHKSKKDRTYKIGESRRMADRQTFAQRAPMFYPEYVAPNAKPLVRIDPETGILRAVIGEN